MLYLDFQKGALGWNGDGLSIYFLECITDGLLLSLTVMNGCELIIKMLANVTPLGLSSCLFCS